MKTLSIDIETYSSVDLAKCGVYKYTEASDFDILLFGYSVDGGPVQVVDLACGETIPSEIIAALTDTSVTKWAFNAQFERICLSRWLRKNGNFDNTGYSIPEDTVGNYLDPASWKCTMIWSPRYRTPYRQAGGRRCRSGAWEAKADRRQRTHQVFLSALCADEGQRRSDPQSAGKRAGQMVCLQAI